jgi:uroporphyrinogen-III synthase
VLLTSLSVGRELRRQVGALPASTLVASIGPGTTRDAERLGFVVGHTARTQSIDALIAELDTLPRLQEVTR